MHQKALILMGAGRSGTTLLLTRLALHPEIQFISNINNRFPSFNYPKKLDSLYRSRRLQKTLRILPKPSEAYHFWDYYFPGFSHSAPQIDPTRLAACKRFFRAHFTSNKTVLTKITGFTRSEVFSKLFDSVKVVWVQRDPIKIVVSILRQKWGAKKVDDKSYFRDINRWTDFWVRKMYEYDEDLRHSGLPFQIVKLEDFLKHPQFVLQKILEFGGIPSAQYFNNYSTSELLEVVNKGREPQGFEIHLPIAQIESRLAPLRRRLGYI